MDCANVCPITNERILLATDGSDFSQGAVREAIRFAKQCSSRLAVTVVVEPIMDGETPTQHAEESMEAVAEKHLKAVKEQARVAGVECETFISFGEPHEVIVQAATKRRSDLIFIGRRGPKGLRRLLVGEVAAKVIGQAECKVLVVPRAAAIGPKTILVASDGSGHSLAAAREAVALAKRCGAAVIALSAMRTEEERKAAETSVREILDLTRAEGVPADGTTPLGRSFKAILETAGGRGVDLIVMGIPVKSAMRKMLSGSSTEQVIGQAGCAVLIVKGEGSAATH